MKLPAGPSAPARSSVRARVEAQAALAAYTEVLPIVRDFAPIVRLHLLRADLAAAKEDTAAAEELPVASIGSTAITVRWSISAGTLK